MAGPAPDRVPRTTHVAPRVSTLPRPPSAPIPLSLDSCEAFRGGWLPRHRAQSPRI